jgi:hypothetical protein
MKIAITQPNFFSWLGYFDLIDSIDVLVFLDNVKFGNKPKRINRNILVDSFGNEKKITLSISHNSSTSLINECVIVRDKNFESNLNVIKNIYSKCKFYKETMEIVKKIYSFKTDNLSEFNINLIKIIYFEIFQKKINFLVASKEFPIKNDNNQEYYISISKFLKAREYYSFRNGFLNGLYDLEQFKSQDIDFFIQDYQHPTYDRPFFKPYASILDLMFTNLDNAKNIILSGRKWEKK